MSLVANWLQSRNDLQKAKIDLQMADIQNRADLLRDKQRFNADWERNSINGSGKVLKYFSFCMFSAPFFVAVFAPHAVSEYFNTAINSIPADWRTMWYAINGGIWGISAIKDHFMSILATIKTPKGNTLPQAVVETIQEELQATDDPEEMPKIPEPFSDKPSA